MKKLLLFVITLSLLSCSKDSLKKDKKAPVIAFISPTNGLHFTIDTLINSNITITDKNNLAEILAHVSYYPSGSVLMDIVGHPAGSSFTITEPISFLIGQSYKIEVTATDIAGNTRTESIIITSP